MAPIRPLAWEHPYAVGAALGKKKKDMNPCDTSEVWMDNNFSFPCVDQGGKGQPLNLEESAKLCDAMPDPRLTITSLQQRI